jgi:hypothetical protein
MKEYHKIKTVYLRDPETRFRTLLDGQFALPEFEYLSGNRWVWTEKVDGTNIRVLWDGDTVRFGGKTDRAQIPVHLLNVLQDTFPPELFREHFQSGPCCFYGEGYGAKIQKGGGRYIAGGCGFILFDVKVDEWWLKRDAVADIASNFDLKAVPVVGFGTLTEAVELVRAGFMSLVAEDKTLVAEGLVLRPTVELMSRSGHRLITKIKCKDFA